MYIYVYKVQSMKILVQSINIKIQSILDHLRISQASVFA